MRAGVAAGARLIEVYRVGVAGKNHVTSTVGYAIVQVCGNISEKLVHGMGTGLSGRGFLGTDCTEGEEDFFVDRAAVPQEGINDALYALDYRIVKRIDAIRIHRVLSLGAIIYGGILVWIDLGL